YTPAKKLLSYELPIVEGFSPLIQRIVAAGRKNERIRLRKVDKSRFDEDAATILAILNDAWGENWGFVPITDAEVAYIGKKLRPLVREDLIMIAEYDGRPVAFLMTLPDINTVIAPLKGSLFPFGWAKLLWWLRTCRSPSVRVPLMGVVKDLQNTRMAAQLAFMLIETIRIEAVKHYGTVRGEIGWVLEDNQGMNAIADAIESKINREYLIYEKSL
ncbi:MAG: N-acetyltransferase, partial [Blastomonas sp.]|nr:N-acetyltransferase [Blastomonas sp.]